MYVCIVYTQYMYNKYVPQYVIFTHGIQVNTKHIQKLNKGQRKNNEIQKRIGNKEGYMYYWLH